MVSLPNCLFLVSSAFFLPFYLILVNRLLRHGTTTFRSPFYSVLLSRGIVDISAASIHILTVSIREFSWAKEFFWNSAHTYMSTFCYAQVYFFLFARLVSTLISWIERLLSIRLPSSLDWISSGPSCLSSVFIWLLPLFLTWPMIIQLDCSFDSKESLHLLVPKNHAQNALLGLTIACFVTSTFSFIIVCYLWRQKRRFREDDFLANCQVGFQTLPVLVLFLYCADEIWNGTQDPPRIFESDSYFSYIQVVLTYSPLVSSFFDKKIRQNVLG